MPRPISIQLHQARTEEILEAARAQLVTEGLAGFSLRAVARRLALAPNALYTYFPSLDDLITALLVDAFRRFAMALESADEPDNPDHVQRFQSICTAYRTWAVIHPIDYDLIFGMPIPGYQAPEHITGPLSIRAFEMGLRVLIHAWRARQLHIPARYQAIPPHITATLAAQVDPAYVDVPLSVRYLMLVVWARLHGMVCLDIHGNADQAIGDLEAFFAHGVACLCEEIGLISQAQ